MGVWDTLTPAPFRFTGYGYQPSFAGSQDGWQGTSCPSPLARDQLTLGTLGCRGFRDFPFWTYQSHAST